jgi:FkbM family methyltransferase
MRHSVKLNGKNVDVDLTGDYYGAEFWNRVSSRRYEPDTVGFIEDRCDENTDFMDIGAANGAMTLIAALSGARVVSYEPDPRIHRVLEKNVSLNKSLSDLIEIKNEAISSTKGKLNFINGQDSSVLSEIVFTGHDSSNAAEVNIASLSEEISRFHPNKTRKLVIKMDIEGAEWKILRSAETLKALQEANATLLLAIHPGFYRPFKPKLRGIDRLRYTLWQLRNFNESVEIFGVISKYANIYRTNLNPIPRQSHFATLALAGYYEFIVEFNAK